MEGVNLEVWFQQQDQVTIFLESSIADSDEEQFYETALFTLFASRQMANGRGDWASQSLAEALFSLDERNPLVDVESRLEGEVMVGSPSTRGGRKGFTAEFRPEKRAFFKLHLHGFGMLGKGVDYYAPTSTLALLCWLLRRRSDDPAYQRAMGTAAKAVGAAGTAGMITVMSQAEIAMQAAGAGWMRPDDILPEGFELSAAAADAADDHGIDFEALYQAATERLAATVEEINPAEDEHVIIPSWLGDRVARQEVWTAVDLGDDDLVVARAFEAMQAAEETRDEATITAASAHYDRTLEETLDKHGLTPLVAELRSLLFTRDLDEAS